MVSGVRFWAAHLVSLLLLPVFIWRAVVRQHLHCSPPVQPPWHNTLGRALTWPPHAAAALSQFGLTGLWKQPPPHTLWLCYCLLLSVKATRAEVSATSGIIIIFVLRCLNRKNQFCKPSSCACAHLHFFIKPRLLRQNLSQSSWFDMLGNWVHHPSFVNIKSINCLMTRFFLFPGCASCQHKLF